MLSHYFSAKFKVFCFISVLLCACSAAGKSVNAVKVIDSNVDVIEAKNSISQQRMSDLVKELSSPKYQGRLPGSEGDELSRDYIVAKFKSIGLIPAVDGSYLQPFRTSITSLGSGEGSGENVVSSNIIGYFEGNDPVLKKEIIIISGHRDHLGAIGNTIWPGANDDLTGVAATLELANAFSILKNKNKRTLVFIAFGAEEQEYMGSMALVAHPIAAIPNKNIVFFGTIDMIGLGYKKWSSFSQGMLNAYAKQWAKDVYNGTFTDEDDYSHEYQAKDTSDCWYDACAFAAHSINNRVFGLSDAPHYHEPTDTWESVQFAPMTIVTKTIFDFLWQLDQDPVAHIHSIAP